MASDLGAARDEMRKVFEAILVAHNHNKELTEVFVNGGVEAIERLIVALGRAANGGSGFSRNR